MFNHILVAFDGSDSAKVGLSMGVNFCKSQKDSQLSVVYVYEDKNETYIPHHPPLTTGDAPFYADSSQAQAIISNSHELINDNPPKMNKLEEIESYVNGLEYSNLIQSHFVVLEGDTEDKILQYAEKEGVDLIIVGKSNTSGLRNLFMDNISEKIIKNSSCPVLISK